MELSRAESGNKVAAKLQTEHVRDLQLPPRQPSLGSGPVPKSMNRVSQARSVAIVLFLLTLAAVTFAGFNFQAERRINAPTDGVTWVERGGMLVADEVDQGSPADKAGIKPGDQLIALNGQEVKNTSGVERQLYRTGIWQKATYSLVRHSVALDSNVILEPAERAIRSRIAFG